LGEGISVLAVVLFLAILASADPQSQALPPAAPAPVPPASTTEAAVSGVTVNGARAQVETAIDRNSYSVANDLNAETGSVADVLRDLPAVQVDAQGNLSLRGDGNVTVLVDGRPSAQFSAGNLAQALQAMPAAQIDRIEVMTNPPAEFRAQGSGGVINLVTKTAKGTGATSSLRVTAASHDRGTVAASFGYNSTKLSATGDLTYQRITASNFETVEQIQTERGTGRTAEGRDLATERWVGSMTMAHLGADYDLDSRTRISGLLSIKLAPYDTVYGDRFSQTDFSGVTVGAQTTASQEYEAFNTGEASLTWRQTFGEGHTLTLNADYKGYEGRDRRLDLFTPVLPGDPSSQRISWTDLSPRETLTADYERSLPGGAKLKLGYDFEYAPKRTDQDTGFGFNGGPITLEPSLHGVFLDTETDNEAYVSYERRFGKATLLAGLRAEDSRFTLEQQTSGQTVSHDYPRLYPNLHLSYDLGDGHQLTASYSRRVNRPYSEQLDPLPLSQKPNALTAGNPDLRPEDIYAYEVGYEDRHGDRSMTETLYYRETRDAFSVVSTSLPNAVTLQTTVNAGAVRRAGAEWTLSNKLTSKISYNFSIDAYWIQLSAANLGFGQAQSSVASFGRANLNWQITRKDFLQINLWANGKNLLPQGYAAGVYSGNIGYRHTINNKASWMLVAQDPFHTLHPKFVLNENGVRDTHSLRLASQMVSLAFIWNFSGKPKDAGFDFAPGGGG
jgi:outer membrane receptor protein involved in Fe transport